MSKIKVKTYKVFCLDCELEGELADWNKDTRCPLCHENMYLETAVYHILLYRNFKRKLLNTVKDRQFPVFNKLKDVNIYPPILHFLSGYLVALYFYPLHNAMISLTSLGLLVFMKHYTMNEPKPFLTLFGGLLGIITGFLFAL